MAVIRVPRTPKSAFNKNRPASKLLKSQVEHLEWAVRPASERKPYQLAKSKSSIRTEGEAAARIEELTRLLHPEGAKSAPPVGRLFAIERNVLPKSFDTNTYGRKSFSR